ncbi:DUF202 domain-containing protein [Rhodococcus sp. NPDC057297]|uniref:DUF202 domain-containing protein n=1 Tax=Rhodococcus sp. NPDC057297 TaxID=3346090 RepID=UPI0036372516
MTKLGVQDTGLQLERTSLSFVRTCLSMFGVTILCLRFFPTHDAIALVGPVVAGILVAAAATCEYRSRSVRAARFAEEHAHPALVVGALLAAGVLLLGASCAWLLLG